MIAEQISHYRIISKLGAGGMGEVYLAEDTKLERSVALKILPAAVASDQQRMHRFIQEAKAASGLNHQNIITIYEIGEADSTHFIATEFIDGVTLRHHMKQSPMTPAEVLDVAIHIASALSAAHDAGIIHRDIKPENIMLRSRDGFVKVLDFGLAKLTERQSGTTDPEAPTRAMVNTDAGTVMGTASYMSPEQARGKPVDGRTDIWSLGVILYEMVTGHLPFTGETATDVIASIVKTEAPPLTSYTPEAPAKLEEIVTKALEKDREERYQTVKDLLVDLRRLRKRLEVEVELERSRPPTMSGGVASATSSGIAAGKTDSDPAVSTREVGGIRTTSSAEYVVSKIKHHKRGALLVLAALVVIIAGVAFGLYKLTSQNQFRSVTPLQAAKLTPITTNGRAVTAAISPDGKYVAFATEEDGKQSLWLRQVAIASNAPIVPLAEAHYSSLTFSRDGNFLYYTVSERTNPTLSGLYQITLLGRNQKRLIAGPITGIFSFA